MLTLAQTTGAWRATTPRAGTWAAAALLCALLAVVHTWPLATSPARLSRNDNNDAQLNEWIMAWVAHQLPRAPAHLFDANIFYPARHTLAFSEPLIVPALISAPVAWAGGSPVLVMNLMVMAGFALTAFAGFALVYLWTGDITAGLLTGGAFAFNTHTLTRLAHVQALHLYGLPLALLATDRLFTTARMRDALWLAVWMAILAYTSGYLFVFAAIMVTTACLVRAREWLPRTRNVLPMFALAAAVAAVAIVPLWVPYHRAAVEYGMSRSLENVAEYSATMKGYLAAAGTIHASTWSRSFFRDPVDSFFPGFVVIALTFVALWCTWSPAAFPKLESAVLARRRVAMLLAIALVGMILSLGTRTPVYGWLYAVFPPMHGLRAAARFGNLFLFGMSVLAGIGLAALRARYPGRGPLIVAIALIALANVEALRAPIQYRRFDGVPGIYKLLASEPVVVLAEVPFYPREAVFENGEYVLNSTAHWRPLMNGYSGYTPATYSAYAAIFWYFPREHAIQAMRQAGVTHVMVHPERFGHEADEVVAALAGRPEFELMAVGSRGIRLYRLH
ncbi:MAG: hypothetical protein V7647_4 [Acidobacteriota bacterium]|jgi:hypothetical protein